MALDDYGALLRSGSASVQDYAGEEAKKQLLATQQGALRLQMLEAQRQIEAEDRFEADLAGVLTNPTAEGYAQLIAKHPKFASGIKESWAVLDKSRQTSDFQAMSEVYSAAANGKPDLAAALMERRIEADKAAGQEVDPSDQAILDALKSGDDVQVKGAMGMIGVTLATIVGPEKFGDTLGKLTEGSDPALMAVGPGTSVIDKRNPAGGAIYESPYRPEIITDPVTGQQMRLVPDTTPAAVSGAQTSAGGQIDLKKAAAFGGQFGRVTSTKRDEATNRRVGGVKNSHHLVGRAVDIARKPGVSHSQIEAAYKAAGYQIIESLDEGDHSHFAFAGGPAPTGGGVPTVRSLQEARALPPGTVFRTPDGRTKVR